LFLGFRGDLFTCVSYLALFTLTKSRRSRNITQKQFRVISNIIHSGKQESQGTDLKKAAFLRTRLGFYIGLTHGSSLKTSNIEA
jgi:hypothetical protein